MATSSHSASCPATHSPADPIRRWSAVVSALGRHLIAAPDNDDLARLDRQACDRLHAAEEAQL